MQSDGSVPGPCGNHQALSCVWSRCHRRSIYQSSLVLMHRLPCLTHKNLSLFCLPFCLLHFFFWNRVSCSPGWPWNLCSQDWPWTPDPPVSPSKSWNYRGVLPCPIGQFSCHSLANPQNFFDISSSLSKICSTNFNTYCSRYKLL